MKAKFLICRHCGNMIHMVEDKGVPVMCCGQMMDVLEPNTVEASGEKHLPDVKNENGMLRVNVGSVEHPMLDEHYIQWVAVETEKGIRIKKLNPGEKPTALFALAEDKAIAVYEYCNLHGLWKTEL